MITSNWKWADEINFKVCIFKNLDQNIAKTGSATSHSSSMGQFLSTDQWSVLQSIFGQNKGRLWSALTSIGTSMDQFLQAHADPVLLSLMCHTSAVPLFKWINISLHTWGGDHSMQNIPNWLYLPRLMFTQHICKRKVMNPKKVGTFK